MKYDAFISYSHAADGRLAPEIQVGLEQFAKPWYRRRAMSIFRDETNLSASPHLWNSIVGELSEAHWFLLLASREAANSKWVAREIEWWLGNRDRNRLLILLTDGEMRWGAGDGATDFDWHRTDALPRSLQRAFDGEPHFIDLRFGRSDANLTLKHTTFRSAILKIAAPVRGMSPEEMDGEAVRIHSRNLRWAAAAIGSLAAITAFAIWQTLAAIESRDTAFSRQLAAQSVGTLERNPDTAMLLAIEAYRIKPTTESRTALLRGLQHGPIEYFLSGHSTPIIGVAFDRDARRVATASEAGKVIVWNIESRPPIELWTHVSDIRVESMAWTSDGALLAIGRDDGRIDILAPGSSNPPRPLAGGHHRRVTTLAFAPGGRQLVSGDIDGSIVFWDPASGKLLGGKPQEHNRHPMRTLAFSPDEKRVYAGGDGGVMVWDATSLRELGPLVDPQNDIMVDALVPSADGKSLFVSGFGHHPYGPDLKVVLLHWSLAESPARPSVMRTKLESVTSLARSADDRLLVAGDHGGRIAIFVAGTERFFKGHNGAARRVAISPDGRRIVSGGEDGRVILWAPDSERPHHSNLGDATPGRANIASTPDGQLISGNREGRMLWMSVKGGKPELKVGDAVSQRGITAIASNPDGGRLAIGTEDGTILLQQSGAPQPNRQVRDWLAGYAITGLSFSPDGQVLVSAHYDGSIVLRDAATAAPRGKPVKIVNDSSDGILGVQYSSDGKRLLVNTQKGILFRDSDSGQPLENHPLSKLVMAAAARTASPQWAFGTAHGSVQLRASDTASVDGALLVVEGGMRILSVAFSRDGAQLAAGGYDARIFLWDVRDRRRIDEPLSQHNAVTSLAFTNDGRHLVARGFDDALEIWNIDAGYWARTLCAIANRRLTELEWSTYLGREKQYQPACVP